MRQMPMRPQGPPVTSKEQLEALGPDKGGIVISTILGPEAAQRFTDEQEQKRATSGIRGLINRLVKRNSQ